MLKNKPLQKQLDDKMNSLKMLIRSRVSKKGTFTLKGADDERAYFKELEVLNEEIDELEDKISGPNKFIWWFQFIINFPSLFRRANKEFNKNVKLGVEGKELIQLTDENINHSIKLVKKIKKNYESNRRNG